MKPVAVFPEFVVRECGRPCIRGTVSRARAEAARGADRREHRTGEHGAKRTLEGRRPPRATHGLRFTEKDDKLRKNKPEVHLEAMTPCGEHALARHAHRFELAKLSQTTKGEQSD